VISPFVTIGLRAGDVQGPKVGQQVSIGTGAKLIGPITIGPRARVGAGAVVVDDVPAEATVVGVPGRVIPRHD
jgi:serine O-acetyltransferase